MKLANTSVVSESRIQGIPCLVVVTAYSPAVPSNRNVDPDRDPYDPGCFEFEVYDRKGYHAPWLEEKMDDDDVDRFFQEFRAEMRGDYDY